MKKIISAILVCVLLMGTMFALTSCGGTTLSGTYKAEDILLGGAITYEFDVLGKVTCTYDPYVGTTETKEGTYKINSDGDKITLTFDEEANTFDFVTGEEGGVKYIKIDLIEYQEVK